MIEDDRANASSWRTGKKKKLALIVGVLGVVGTVGLVIGLLAGGGGEGGEDTTNADRLGSAGLEIGEAAPTFAPTASVENCGFGVNGYCKSYQRRNVCRAYSGCVWSSSGGFCTASAVCKCLEVPQDQRCENMAEVDCRRFRACKWDGDQGCSLDPECPRVEASVVDTLSPTVPDTLSPTVGTISPTLSPTTISPTLSPTTIDTLAPTTIDTLAPTTIDTLAPTTIDTLAPTTIDTLAPTTIDTLAPTTIDTLAPTTIDTLAPTVQETFAPSSEDYSWGPTPAPTKLAWG